MTDSSSAADPTSDPVDPGPGAGSVPDPAVLDPATTPANGQQPNPADTFSMEQQMKMGETDDNGTSKFVFENLKCRLFTHDKTQRFCMYQVVTLFTICTYQKLIFDMHTQFKCIENIGNVILQVNGACCHSRS